MIFQNLLIAAGLIVAVILFGQLRYNQGYQAAKEEFQRMDQRGAEEVRSTTDEVLDSIGRDPNIERLLGETGGQRDE